MAVTIYDVAKRAGVGIGTVSRVINESPQITAATKTKVLKAIKDLNYQPHALAQGLARKKTQMIAIVVPFFTGYFFNELLRGIQQEIFKYQYNLVLYNIDEGEQIDELLKKALRERRVDGALLISHQISDKIANKIKISSLPFVLVDSYHPSLDSIVVENKQGAFEATRHLIQLGHKKIGMIDGQLKSSPAKIRLEGFKQALLEYNIPFKKEYLVISDYITGQHGFNREAGYHAMKQLLKLAPNHPTAVFVSSDIQAVGAIKAIDETGLKIPQDIAIVGFDDIEIAEFLGLTTMRQPMLEMGKLAVQRLISKISNTASKDFKISFSTKLVIRNSCGALGHSRM
ncbi:LacI family DNA-binding transcriptional regulator [candidate division KSB1 bacterium]|nr:LacI family DNA-binding transcriptional regulator [candidate division KSB1 bacterium]